MILDIVLVIIILLSTFIGYKKGFVKVIIKLCTFVVAIILAFLLQSSVAEFIGESLGFNTTIHTAIENNLEKFTTNKDGEEKQEINIPVLENTIDKINGVAEDKKTEAISKWSDKITAFVIKGISFIAIFAVVSILMGIIGLILDTVVSLPVLKTLNGTLGAGVGFVLVLLRILILLAIVSFLSPLEIMTVVTNYIEQSCITKWLYENNIIISIIGRNLL